MKHFVFIAALLLTTVKCKSVPGRASVLTSKYAKVSRFGVNNTNEANLPHERTSKRQNFWSNRSGIQNIESTTKKRKPGVAYQFPVYQTPDVQAERRIEHIPGIGEVIVAQDRFEARPLFAYKNKLAATYGPPLAPKTTSAPVATPAPPSSLDRPQPPSFSSFPVFNNPSAPSSPSRENLYNSPYSSYNPPEFMPDDSVVDSYPPNTSPTLKINTVASTTSSTEAAKTENAQNSYASLGPPLALYGDNPPPDYDHDHSVAKDPMEMYKNHDGPPEYPPKSEDDVYYPPDFPKDQVNHDADMHASNEDMMDHHKPMMNKDPMTDSGKANGAPPGDDMDLAPPPLHDFRNSFPEYLYDHHHYDHHVYEEIPHTTMPPAKEDKRVSSTHYSYYYLGRKLWYIPLYFSIYFIIYITVLILKSIARHKVQLKYKWAEQDSSKQARNLDLGSIKEEEISNVYKKVSQGILNATEKYTSVMAM